MIRSCLCVGKCFSEMLTKCSLRDLIEIPLLWGYGWAQTEGIRFRQNLDLRIKNNGIPSNVILLFNHR